MDPILYELLDGIVRHIYKTANEWADGVREAAQDDNPSRYPCPEEKLIKMARLGCRCNC